MEDGQIPNWLPVLVAAVPAAGAIIAAVVAGVYASRARTAQDAAETERRLRQQLAASKAEVYEPMVELLRAMLDASKAKTPISDKKVTDTLSKFAAWLSVYGSDQAVLSFHKFMQAAYHEPTPQVQMYYYGQFLLAIRKDLGHPDTKLGAPELLGLRINDIWEASAGLVGLPEKEFLAHEEWDPPWPPDIGRDGL
jgi:hypothetical protein